jgi:hypothetical protein
MPRSRAEVRLAHSVLEGKARDSGMSAAYAREVVQKMHGHSMSELPSHTKPRRVKVRRHQREA